jgi:hypothetical protein
MVERADGGDAVDKVDVGYVCGYCVANYSNLLFESNKAIKYLSYFSQNIDSKNYRLLQ